LDWYEGCLWLRRVNTISIQSRLVEHRRRHVRRLPAGGVRVQIAGLALTLELCDLCLDGFAVVTTRPFWRGMTHRFTFSSDAGLEATLVAKAVHCYSVPQEGDRKFVTGWEFMAGSADRTAAAIGPLFTTSTETPPPSAA
jgi:hypothetical protein